ncbi:MULTISPECIES: GNAT family N-acetyltransferase [Vagococcus]|uniref:GNAT family N-acetyltransferase n=1 Tax=Vagococcus TaxID=2737 RepID=UPI0015C67844|nr:MULTISPECIES: GNAT family N-acetyltransferase [Vagococcus]
MTYVEEKNCFVAFSSDQKEAGEITWSSAGDTMIIIDHTYVDQTFRGQGIAEELVALAASYARKNHKKVIPLCPFAKKVFEQKTEYHDLLK